MLGNEEVLKELTEIRKALKAEEGYYIYTSTSHVTTLENLLKEYPLRYIKNDTLMADLYEYIINCRNHQWKELRERIAQSGFKAYCSNVRLPISGTIGTINAVVEKAQVYGYDNAAADWKAIYETDNSLHVRLKADDAGLAQESTLSALNGKFESYNRSCHSTQVTVGTSASAILASSTKARYARLQAPSGNTDTIRIGDSTNQYYELAAGSETELYDVDLNTVYVISGTASQTLNVIYIT